MKKLGIKYQILLITLIPVVLIDSFFTFRQIRDGIEQQNNSLYSQGQAIAGQIVARVELSRANNNTNQIQPLLQQAVAANDIVHASVYSSQGELVAIASADDYRNSDAADYYYFRQPVLLAGVDTSAPFNPGSGSATTAGSVNLLMSRASLRQKTMQIIAEASLFFILALALAIALTILISRRITEPVFRLIEHLRYVETGQLGKTIEPTESNEIGALQKGFNRMSHALVDNQRQLNHRIQQATQQLNEAITDLESRNRELGIARDLAQDANRTKSEFLANMSHEIRTPINAIKGFIGLLGQSSLEPSQQRHVDILSKSASDLSSIVNEILDFSKIESGKLQIVDEEFDLYEVIEQTRDILFINLPTECVDLNLIIFSDTPRRVIGDKLRLKQILLNLIGNAIKFTEEGRVVIQVGLQDLSDERVDILMTVTDTGIGISNADQESLFQAFSQVESSNTRRFSGTGLGLAISQNLANLMGGQISMESIAGKGSKFSLNLPFALGVEHQHLYDENVNALSCLIIAAEQTNLMEIRALFDRAGALTEAEMIDGSRGVEAALQRLQPNLGCFDLLVFDLRNFDIDLGPLLKPIAEGSARVIVMHYDPDYNLDCQPESIELVSIVSSSASIRQLLEFDPADAVISRAKISNLPAKSKRVLLVDDNQINLKLASELIRLWGHDVQESDNASDAFDHYQHDRFDLIILDIQMPEIDGISLLHMMRALKPEDGTPIVALTANVLNDEAERLLATGFDYFLGKPIDEAEFRGLLDGDSIRRYPIDNDGLIAGEDHSLDSSLDLTRSLQLAAGNTTLLRQILEILQRDIPEQRQHLQAAFSDFDLDRLGALAHKLHGVTCYASLPRLRRSVLAFEPLLDTATAESLEPAVIELDKELAAVAAAVERYLQQFPQSA